MFAVLFWLAARVVPAMASCVPCEAGRAVITRAACGSCHEIPGILEISGEAGPPLAQFSKRTVIAGMLPNSPDNLAYWLRFPQRIVPGNSMPNTGLTESEARDAAAYLESLK
jgi:cytochrome c1